MTPQIEAMRRQLKQIMTTQHASDDVLVIGAGPAGIASAYALQQANISYKVIDRAEQIGNTWASLYPSLTLNTSRYFSHMPEKPFPSAYGIFPTGKQYHRYLLDFVNDHNFNIQLGVEVYRVSPEGNLWRVETSEGTFLYKVVIPATGIWNNPIMPEIEGMNAFTGEMYHAHFFRDTAQVKDKRVLVVGNGPSGIDIAVASGEVADKAYIGIRSGVNLSRRYPLGLPKHTWLMLGDMLPKAWCKRLMKFVGSFKYSDAEQYGLTPPPAGSGGMTGYAGDELLNAVKAGTVTPVSAPVRFEGNKAILADGDRLEVDTVIMATGYEPVLHQYMDVEFQFNGAPWTPQSICDWEIGPNGQRGFPLRDTSEHPNGRQVAGYEGLYLVGTFYKGKGAMYNFNIEAEIAAQQIKQYLTEFQETMPAVAD
ncbi:MAG: NAD(P)/FAD-dependent oxidoreductase [Chloroflexota bacterium]